MKHVTTHSCPWNGTLVYYKGDVIGNFHRTHPLLDEEGYACAQPVNVYLGRRPAASSDGATLSRSLRFECSCCARGHEDRV